MSGILRNTLRLVGTVPTNRTKYLQSMTLTKLQPNYLNHNEFERLQFIQAKKISTGLGTIIRAGKKISSIFRQEEKKVMDIGPVTLSLTNGKLELTAGVERKRLTFQPSFTTQFDGKEVQLESNKIFFFKKNASFLLREWDVSLDDGELTLKLKGSDETFILNHAVRIEAQRKLKVAENGGLICRPKLVFADDLIDFPVKIIAEQEGLEPFTREYLSEDRTSTNSSLWKNLFNFRVETLTEPVSDADREITDTPNPCGQMKLKFPMTVSLEGGHQTVQFKNSDNTVTFHHTFQIKAYKDKLMKEIARKSIRTARKPGIVRMKLESGNLCIKPNYSDRSFGIAHEVIIDIDLYNEVPTISVHPFVQTTSTTDN